MYKSIINDSEYLFVDRLHKINECVQWPIRGCSAGTVSVVSRVQSLLDSLAQLSGTCPTLPFTCSPDIAADCARDLAHSLLHFSGPSDDKHICR